MARQEIGEADLFFDAAARLAAKCPLLMQLAYTADEPEYADAIKAILKLPPERVAELFRELRQKGKIPVD
jgi:hypothetical protein